MMTMLEDPLSSVATWTTLAFLLWVLFTWLVHRLRIPQSALITASLSWIVARLFLSILPTIIHRMDLW